MAGLADDDNINGYRELGLAEDATYDEVMDAFMSLSETYSDNPERMMVSPAAPYRSTPRPGDGPPCFAARRRSSWPRTRCWTSG